VTNGSILVSPFDIKSVLLARHAQHVVLIHFPIALFLAGTAFDLAAQWSARWSAQRARTSALAAAAYYNLLLAAWSTLPVVITGLLAWRWQLEGAALKGNLKLHLVLGIASSILIWMTFWLHAQAHRRPDLRWPAYRWPVELLAALVVGLTGHVGGFLSGVNGQNRRSGMIYLRIPEMSCLFLSLDMQVLDSIHAVRA
jgi:uncharacterized membrane protein